MSEVVELSDSDDVPSHEKLPDQRSPVNDTDFNFPEVQFDYESEQDDRSDDRDFPINLDSPQCDPPEEQLCSDPDISSNDLLGLSQRNERESKDKESSPLALAAVDSSESENEAKGAKRKKTLGKDRARVREERQRKQQIAAREKALKAVASKKARDIRPGDCMKFVEVILDEGIGNAAYFNEIVDTLKTNDLKYTVNSQLIPNSITWRRSVEESYVSEDNEIKTVSNTLEEKQMIVIWSCNETVQKIVDGTFCSCISDIKIVMPKHVLTLVIFGMEQYFSQQKKRKETRTDVSEKKCKSRKKSNELPIVTFHQLERHLTQVQITDRCNSRLVEKAEDLALMIYQYTKAIAEIPYKEEKMKKLEENFTWYALGDNRDTIPVDKDGNGLKRLWQRQLSLFNLSSLEIAEAICSVYPSPVKLVDAYSQCTPEEGMNLLKDIPVRRVAGPLSTSRKVGPELSRRIYVMFTSEDGDALLE